MVYFIVKNRETRDDLGEEYHDRQRQEQRQRRHIKHRQRLGYSVEVTKCYLLHELFSGLAMRQA